MMKRCEQKILTKICRPVIENVVMEISSMENVVMECKYVEAGKLSQTQWQKQGREVTYKDDGRKIAKRLFQVNSDRKRPI